MTRNDWEVVRIWDIAKVISWYAFKAKDFLTIWIPVIKIKNIKIGNVEFDNDSSYVLKVPQKKKQKTKKN